MNLIIFDLDGTLVDSGKRILWRLLSYIIEKYSEFEAKNQTETL